LTGRPICFIDFEFNESAEPFLNLVCCSYTLYDPDNAINGESFTATDIWLLNSDTQKNNLKLLLDIHAKRNTIFISYGVAAESRSFEALDLDPHHFTWVCLYAEWRQLTYNNYSCQYGTYFTATGFERHSIPPSFQKEKNRGRDNKAVGFGLVDCVAQLFEVWVDSVHKNAMRDLILENQPNYSPNDQLEIMKYCRSDLLYLPSIWLEQLNRLNGATRLPTVDLLRIQYRRGAYMVSTGKMESVGTPINIEKVRNLRKNFEMAQNEILIDLVENYYPFYIKEKKSKKDWSGTWTEKYAALENFLESKGMLDKWPRTVDKKTGRTSNKLHTMESGYQYRGTLSKEEKILERFDGVPELYAYRQAKKNLGQLAWFKKPSEKKLRESGDFFDNVGSDNRLRTFMGPFGSQTSRNQPSSKKFIFAMAHWLRCLIEPPPGYVIISADYSGQEFGIAGVKSRDQNMIKAYDSGDQYLYFAKMAKAVPKDANPKWCKDPSLAPETEQKAYKDHKWQRGLFKNTTLGLQFGMGYVNLAIKLTADIKEYISERVAQNLINLHTKSYKTYWRWLDTIIKEYRRNKCLILWDGWALLGNNDNDLSVKNFPVQGTGGVILREMVRLCHEKKMDILATLHDAGYFLVREDLEDHDVVAITQLMKQAFVNVLGDSLDVRIDVEIHRNGKDWVEEKGEKYFKLLSKYLEYMETGEDHLDHLLTTIYQT